MTDIAGIATKAAFKKDRGLYGAGPDIAYPETPGEPIVISDATNATPIVIETTTHTFVTGDGVRIASVGGNTAANGDWVITVVDSTHFSLDTSVGNGAYTSGGLATEYAALAATHLVPFSEESMSKTIEHLKATALVGSGQVLPQGLIGITAAGGLGGPLTYTGWERLIAIAMGYENPEDSSAFLGTPAAAVNVADATNAAPIVVETATHGYTTGDGVRIASVGGNTNANGDWSVTVVDATHFSLDGSTGNAAYTAGGTAVEYFAFAHLFELDESLQDQAWAAAELDGYTPPSANDRKVRREMLGFKKATDYVTSSCYVNKMTISGSPSEMKISFDLIGYDVVTGAYNSANWTLPTGSAAHCLFQQMVVLVGTRAAGIPTTEYGISGFELTVNNNLKADDQSTASAPNILMPIRTGPREVSLKLDFPRYNTAFETLSAYAGLNTEMAASLGLTGPALGGGYDYQCNFYMSSLRIKNPTASISKAVLTPSIELEAARPGGSDVFEAGGSLNGITLMKDSELVVKIINNVPKNYILEE